MPSSAKGLQSLQTKLSAFIVFFFSSPTSTSKYKIIQLSPFLVFFKVT